MDLRASIINRLTVRGIAVILLALGIIAAVLDFQIRNEEFLGTYGFFLQYFSNLSGELSGIAVTVLIIDYLYDQHETQQAKERLIQQVRSRQNWLSLWAIEELRRMGWLTDGSMIGVDLKKASLQNAILERAVLAEVDFEGANLEGAILMSADLRRARLVNVNFQGAKLWDASMQDANLEGANLKGAGLTDDQLRQTSSLWRSIMPDGNLYDGTLQLPGDREKAQAKGVDFNSQSAMDNWYLNGEG